MHDGLLNKLFKMMLHGNGSEGIKVINSFYIRKEWNVNVHDHKPKSGQKTYLVHSVSD